MVRVLWVVAVLSITNGCSEDRCFGVVKSECSGQNIVHKEGCEDDLGFHTEHVSYDYCQFACAPPGFCALSSSPDPHCASAGADHKVCDGATLASCRDAYLIANESCAAACVSGATGEFCALSDMPDPLCNSSSPDICDANLDETCRDGFVISSTDCAAKFCVVSEMVSQCALSPDPDPRCPATGSSQLCTGGDFVTCAHGYATATENCDCAGACSKLEDCNDATLSAADYAACRVNCSSSDITDLTCVYRAGSCGAMDACERTPAWVKK